MVKTAAWQTKRITTFIASIPPAKDLSILMLSMYNCRGEREREREEEGEGREREHVRDWLVKSVVNVCVSFPSSDLIVFHLESLTDLRKELKRLPVAKVSHVMHLL